MGKKKWFFLLSPTRSPPRRGPSVPIPSRSLADFDYFKIQLFFISFFSSSVVFLHLKKHFFLSEFVVAVCFAAWPLFEIGTCLFKALLLVFLGIVVACFPHVLCINLCHSATVVPFPVPLGTERC